MHVATFNILHGRTVSDGVDPQRLRECVRHLDPDLLGLQEVDFEQPRSDRADLTAVAAEAMEAVEHRFVAAISGTPGATWMAATGHEQPGTAAFGIALLSRFPAASWQVVRLPRIPVRFPMYLPGPNKVMIVDEEPRAVFRTRLEWAPAAPTDPRPAWLPESAAVGRRPQPHTRGGATPVGHAAASGGREVSCVRPRPSARSHPDRRPLPARQCRRG